jgi:serine/threonine protein kinase
MKLEVQIMYKLDHPNIIKLFNHFEDNDSFYLILELASKGQLYTRLQRLGRLEERAAAQYIREVVSAVSYLHSLKPPIIHRDIKPENILLDSKDVGKLCDFGWSNFFNGTRKRMTYCGTPEYLAPEMIKQGGHDESLDLWNIGVLAYELLTGKPPFEGANQSELYDNIVKVRINFPKDFSKLAKDLVQRLLKANPKERIVITELVNHAWFKANTPLRAPPKETVKMSCTPDGQIKYEVLSKKSSYTNQEVHNTRPEEVKNLNLRPSKKKGDKQVEELSNKYQVLNKEYTELKIRYQMKSKEVDAAKKENESIKQELSNAGKGIVPSSTVEMRKLTEELQKLKLLNKDKNEKLEELDKRNAQITDQEIKLKLLRNEIEIEKNSKGILDAKITESQERVDTLEKKYESLKQAHDELQKEKRSKEEDLEVKIAATEKKLNSSASDNDYDNEAMIDLIKDTLNDIKRKIQGYIKEQKEEEKTRTDVIKLYKQLAELRYKHDNDLCDIQLKSGVEQRKLEEESRSEQTKVVKEKEEKIGTLSKELRDARSKAVESEVMAEKVRNLESLLVLQKKLIADMNIEVIMQGKEEEALLKEINNKKEKIGDLEYQCKDLKGRQNIPRRKRQPKPMKQEIFI